MGDGESNSGYVSFLVQNPWFRSVASENFGFLSTKTPRVSFSLWKPWHKFDTWNFRWCGTSDGQERSVDPIWPYQQDSFIDLRHENNHGKNRPRLTWILWNQTDVKTHGEAFWTWNEAMKLYLKMDMREVSIHKISSYNNLSHFIHKCFQLGDTKISLKPKI